MLGIARGGWDDFSGTSAAFRNKSLGGARTSVEFWWKQEWEEAEQCGLRIPREREIHGWEDPECLETAALGFVQGEREEK